jgi:hypothetical protein
MLADNSHHVIAAAQRRAQQIRQRAITALRRMGAIGQHLTFDTVARERTSPGPGSTLKTTCAPRSNNSANDTRPRPLPRFLPQRQRASDSSGATTRPGLAVRDERQ